MLNYQQFLDDLWFLRRDIVSDGYDQALEAIAKRLPLQIDRYRSGQEAWTWIIPPKWSVGEAWIRDGSRTLVDVRDHPLHVMSYSTPIAGRISRAELLAHLHTRPDLPSAIPFEFSYYEPKWGFCVQHQRLDQFTAPEYEVLIEARHEPGELKTGTLLAPGQSDDEILVMAHLCHPAMVNDDLAGVAVLVAVAEKLLASGLRHRYSYRFLLMPETIGSIAFLSRHPQLIERIRYAVFLEMLGNNQPLSLQLSRQGDSAIDKAARLALTSSGLDFRTGGFHEVIGNDEKVFNGPGVNIPSISLSRSNFFGRGEWPYPEYHSSADTPAIVTRERLEEAEQVVLRTLQLMENAYTPVRKVRGPIFLSRYGLWVDWRADRDLNRKQSVVLESLEGEKDTLDIAAELDLNIDVLTAWLDQFARHGLIEKRQGNRHSPRSHQAAGI